MAHARRYLKDAILRLPEIGDRANQALDYIGKIYRIERDIRQRKNPVTAEEWVEIRQKHSVPIMTEFKAWLEYLAPKLPPKMPLGVAVNYTLGQWTKLSVFLKKPIPIDNNKAESSIRPFVIGRKN